MIDSLSNNKCLVLGHYFNLSRITDLLLSPAHLLSHTTHWRCTGLPDLSQTFAGLQLHLMRWENGSWCLKCYHSDNLWLFLHNQQAAVVLSDVSQSVSCIQSVHMWDILLSWCLALCSPALSCWCHAEAQASYFSSSAVIKPHNNDLDDIRIQWWLRMVKTHPTLMTRCPPFTRSRRFRDKTVIYFPWSPV